MSCSKLNPDGMKPWTPHCAQSVWGRLWEKGMACSICRKACLHKNAKMPWKATCLDGPGKTKCCYLGVWDDADGRSNPDISKRIAAAHTAWRAMQGWWRTPHVQLKNKVMVFRSLILGSLLSGLEAATLTQNDVAQLERVQMKYVRSICGKFAYKSLL